MVPEAKIMIPILVFLIQYCSSLFDKHHFRIIDSKVGRNAMEGASVLLTSEDVEIFLANERDELVLDIRSLYDPNARNWHSFDLIGKLFGWDVKTAIMNSDNGTIFAENLDTILDAFKSEKVSQSLASLKKIKTQRTKLLFS